MESLKNVFDDLGKIEKPSAKTIGVATSAFLGTWLAYKLTKFIHYKRKYKHIPGPPTRGLFGYFFGHIREVEQYVNNDKNVEDYFLAMVEKYGSTFKLQLLSAIFIVTIDPDTVKEILITKNYPKSEIYMLNVTYPYGERFLGSGVLTEMSNAMWKDRRGKFNPGFHKNILNHFVADFNIKADMMLEKLRHYADGKQVVNLFTTFNSITLDAIAEIAFGMEIDSMNDEAKGKKIKEAINTVLRTIENLERDSFAQYKFLSSNKREMKKAVIFLRDVGRERILQKLKEIDQDLDQDDSKDILSSILRSWKDADLDLEVMVDDFVTFFIAGQETTSNVLAFTIHCLARDSDILRRAREEIDTVLGEKGEITYQNAVDLKYCTAIFKETMRLHPVIGVLERETQDDLIIGGFSVPKKTSVMMSTFVSSRQESNFPNVMEFNPDRFMKSDSKLSVIPSYTYYPFSLGPRNCIGQNFAQIEGVIMFAKLIQHLDFDLQDKDKPIEKMTELTTKPKNGVPCTLTLRA